MSFEKEERITIWLLLAALFFIVMILIYRITEVEHTIKLLKQDVTMLEIKVDKEIRRLEGVFN